MDSAADEDGGILQMDVDVGEVIINENLILEPPDLLVPYTDERMRALGYPTERTEEPRSRSPSPAPSIESVKEEHSEQTQNHNDSTNDEDEGRLCPICLDNWTNTGEHRVCSLKCGHLFGLKCVNRWISSQTRKSCPTCKKRVIKSDIRNIYAKKLIAIDTSEIEIVKEQLEKVTEEKNRVQMELTKALCREHLLKQQVSDLKTEMHGLQQTLECRKLSQLYTVEKSENASKMKMRFYMDKSLELCSSNGCRVLASNPHLDLVVASVKSPNTLFTGYGVRKVSISHYRTTAFIPLHSAAIRDLVFHPVNDWIATVSIDKSFKIVDGNTNSVAFSVTCESQLWSCCWDTSNSNVFYAGAQQGSVYKYDIRRIREVVCTYNVPGDMSPVVSVAAVCGGPGEPLTHGGIVSCKLNSIWVFENAGEDYVRHCLPIEGPFVCMRYHNSTKQLLVSSRPNSRTPYARHALCTISNEVDDVLGCNTVHSFNGGGAQKLLSRTTFLSDSDYVAAHHEMNKSVCVYSVNTGSKVSSVPAHDPVLDICDVTSGGTMSLACLTEKKLEFFKLAK